VTGAHRRDSLTTRANPDSRHDYLVTLRADSGPGTWLTVRYVPDRAVITPEGFAAYVASLPAGFDGLEAMALAILDDINNEAVPRWVEVQVRRDRPVPQRVVVEDRQPSWDNPHLFARLSRL
jgi:NADPH-dependent 7-cyano-7-deazaguanine reductase QueF